MDNGSGCWAVCGIGSHDLGSIDGSVGVGCRSGGYNSGGGGSDGETHLAGIGIDRDDIKFDEIVNGRWTEIL